MAERAAADLALELASERKLLLKADADIVAGRGRLHNQQELLNSLRNAGHNTVEAERLVGLMTDTLVEWERHRVLIQDRVDYLERKQSEADQG
jgi:RecB family exonuclease